MKEHCICIFICMYVYVHIDPSLGQNNDYHLLNTYYMPDFGALTYVVSFGLILTTRQISTQISIFLSSSWKYKTSYCIYSMLFVKQKVQKRVVCVGCILVNITQKPLPAREQTFMQCFYISKTQDSLVGFLIALVSSPVKQKNNNFLTE